MLNKKAGYTTRQNESSQHLQNTVGMGGRLEGNNGGRPQNDFVLSLDAFLYLPHFM